MKQSSAYLIASDSSRTSDFFSDVFRRYFERFHWSIPDDADPDEHEILDLGTFNNASEEELELVNEIIAEIFDRKKKVCRTILLKRFDFH